VHCLIVDVVHLQVDTIYKDGVCVKCVCVSLCVLSAVLLCVMCWLMWLASAGLDCVASPRVKWVQHHSSTDWNVFLR
jgi:hypothetical protein